jgi:hypothetical protein
MAPAVCLGFEALSEWYLGEIALAIALYLGGILARFERNPAEVERCALNMII